MKSDEYRELLTDELAVTVASVLPEGFVTDELRPVRAPFQARSLSLIPSGSRGTLPGSGGAARHAAPPAASLPIAKACMLVS